MKTALQTTIKKSTPIYVTMHCSDCKHLWQQKQQPDTRCPVCNNNRNDVVVYSISKKWW